jgi:hypothetical protein
LFINLGLIYILALIPKCIISIFAQINSFFSHSI